MTSLTTLGPAGISAPWSRAAALCVWICSLAFVSAPAPAASISVSPSERASWIDAVVGDDDPKIRRWAAWRLGGTHGADVREALAAALVDDDELVREYAARSLGTMGSDAVDVAIGGLRAARSRPHALEVLVGLGGDAVPRLASMLEDPDPGVRDAAIGGLAELGPGARDAVPSLAQALRRHAAGPLGRRIAIALGEIGEPSVDALIELLDEDVPAVRENAIRAIGFAGSAARAAAKPLVASLDDPNPRVRFSVAFALGEIGAEAAVPHLVERVRVDDNRSVRSYAAEALGKIGRRPDEVAPVLIEMLEREDDSLCRRVAAALHGLGPSAIPHVERALEEGGERVRMFASGAAVGPGDHAAALIPALVRRLGDPVEEVRRQSANALRAMGDTSRRALIDAAKTSTDSSIRGYAVLVMGETRSTSPDVVDALIGAMGDDAPSVRRLAAWALGNGGPQDPAAVSVLERALSSGDAVLRRTAAWALGNIGQPAEPAVPALTPLLEDDDAGVREEAGEALKKIRGTYAFTGAGAS